MKIEENVVSKAPTIRIRVTGDRYFSAGELASIIYDLELLHDLAVVLSHPSYKDYFLTRFFTYRNERRVRTEHQLMVLSARIESPLDILVSLPSAISSDSTFYTWLDLLVSAGVIFAVAETWWDKRKIRKLDIQLKERELAEKYPESKRQYENSTPVTTILRRIRKRLSGSELLVLQITSGRSPGIDKGN
jgi:hypothetical protein